MIPYIMRYEKSVVIENEKFIRFKIDDFNVLELYNVLMDRSFVIFFLVFDDEYGIKRQKISKINNFDDFTKILNNSLKSSESGINSSDLCISEATFIDCYKYPK